jgi:signal transduction histidine kinase
MIFKPDLICFHISDNGIGFDMNEVNNTPNSGSGLLHILQRIKVIGGSIDIISNPEQGTLFKITYPIH